MYSYYVCKIPGENFHVYSIIIINLKNDVHSIIKVCIFADGSTSYTPINFLSLQYIENM